MILSGNNSGLSGGVNVGAGTLGIGSNTALGSGLLTVGSTSAYGTVCAVGAAHTISNDTVLLNGTVGGAQNIEFSGTVTGGGISVTNTAQTTFSGNVHPDGGTFVISFPQYAGAGLTTLSGTVGKNAPVEMGIFGVNDGGTAPSNITINGNVNIGVNTGWVAMEVSYYHGTITIADGGSITINDTLPGATAPWIYLGGAGDNHLVLATDNAIKMASNTCALYFSPQTAPNDPSGWGWSIDAVGGLAPFPVTFTSRAGLPSGATSPWRSRGM